MKKHIPNLITCLNLFAGCIACVMAFKGFLSHAFCWILVAAVMDFFDGMAARVLKAYSPVGKELDSLADMVSFGLAPGIMIFTTLVISTKNLGLDVLETYLPYLAFVITVFSALRLAKFNVDERQTSSFIGLPTPANAMFWASLLSHSYLYPTNYPLLCIVVIIVLIILFSWLMVSEIPMFSLKIQNFSWKDNQLRYILVIGSIVAFVFLQWTGIAAAIVLYIFMSVCCRKETT